jgi:hypothetical protein
MGEKEGVSDVVDVLLEGAVVLIHEDIIRGGVILIDGGTVIIDEVSFIFDVIDDSQLFCELFLVEFKDFVCLFSFGTQCFFC